MHLLKPTRNAVQLTALILGLFALSACSSSKNKTKKVDTSSYSQLSDLNQKNSPTDGIATTQFRMEALKDTALQVGAQGGLAWRSEKINVDLLKQAKHLRNVFNFNALILDNGILPPVLTQGNNTLNLDSPTTIRITDKSYKIVSNARFDTAPPNWRDYLITHFKKPEVPNKVLLPKTKDEKEIWKEYLDIGWKNGIEQADTIYSENLAKLKRDYEGMILYRKLLAMHMVTPPYVAETDLGVTGDRNHLNIGDKVLRISALPGLNVDSHTWKAFIVEE